MEFDDQRTASLDGRWDFYPGDHKLEELDRLPAASIAVPGLWEAQGWLDLDGVAWCRRQFSVDDVAGGWTLRFGAVMDLADVYLNGTLLGSNDLPFTPFELDAAPALREGGNDLAVRIVDPSLDDPDHVRMAHGKQGWANHVFPSRPSLYMTYGGIWQPVTLRRHGPVVITSVFANGDPEDLVVAVEIENRGPAATCRVGIRTLGQVHEVDVDVAAHASTSVKAPFSASRAPRWEPERPVLHHALADVWVDGVFSDSRTVRYGVRTVTFEGRRLHVNGVPYRMKSVLVQGFGADTLYAEGSPEQIREEVAAAQAMGFNTLRLHIKAFDPAYLEVCDEMGMLVHSDIPVAEPIAHEEMGQESVLTRRSLAAARAQVRRDRNHPAIILWSAMNEIGDGRREARSWPGYEAFARAMAGAITDEDGTRPVIENDWIEPDPDRVFVSPILTAHWYGRLHREYLDKLENASRRWENQARQLFVTEFGDWGLPDMPLLEDPPFWDTRAVYASTLAATQWPATVGRFAIETQRYQGLADRLQAEVFRRHDHIGGYCLTELTDVPHELNGLLDLNRRPKPLAIAEMRRANQVVLPMLWLQSLVVSAGGSVHSRLDVANDGPALPDCTVEVRFGDTAPAQTRDELLVLDARKLTAEQIEGRFRETVCEVRVGDLPGHTVTSCTEPVTVMAPEVSGSHDLVLRLRSAGDLISENRYPIHVVAPAVPGSGGMPIRLLGGSDARAVLEAAGAVVGDEGTTVVAEEGLDEEVGRTIRARLDAGEVVLVLAQRPEAAAFYPIPVALEELVTAWGSTMFRFSTDHGALPSLPRRAVLVAEDSTIQAMTAVASIEDRPFPDTPVVIAYKPVPGALTGTVVGSHGVGAAGGRLVFCQYRLAGGAAAGDPAACALLADLLAWATRPRPVMAKEATVTEDGRTLLRYSWSRQVAG